MVQVNLTVCLETTVSERVCVQVLYLGGPPPPLQSGSTEPPTTSPATPSAPEPAPPPAPAPPAAPEPDDSAYFKGVIQDVQVR